MGTPLVSNLQRFSVDDGPGIRTTVFLKGCNLRCLWCHNPECIGAGRTLQLTERACISCGRCVPCCPNGVHEITPERAHLLHRERCTACGACQAACKMGIPVYQTPNSPDCVRCGACKRACPHGAIGTANACGGAARRQAAQQPRE